LPPPLRPRLLIVFVRCGTPGLPINFFWGGPNALSVYPWLETYRPFFRANDPRGPFGFCADMAGPTKVGRFFSSKMVRFFFSSYGGGLFFVSGSLSFFISFALPAPQAAPGAPLFPPTPQTPKFFPTIFGEPLVFCPKCVINRREVVRIPPLFGSSSLGAEFSPGPRSPEKASWPPLDPLSPLRGRSSPRVAARAPPFFFEEIKPPPPAPFLCPPQRIRPRAAAK